jgi:hypothetical protein
MLKGWKLAFACIMFFVIILGICIKAWDTAFQVFVVLFGLCVVPLSALLALMWLAENTTPEEPRSTCRCHLVKNSKIHLVDPL